MSDKRSLRKVRAHARRLVRRIRRAWPATTITLRGDGHYARPELMRFCEEAGVHYVFGLPGTRPLLAKVDSVADAVRTRRADEDADPVRALSNVNVPSSLMNEAD